MAIEILEFIVRGNITTGKAQEAASNPMKEQLDQLIDKQLLTEEIVEQVLGILHHQNER